jgi:hypothetical protein
MHPEKIWLVLLILILVLAGSNLLMFAIARGFRGFHIDPGKSVRDLTKPWQKEDDSLAELSQRVKELKSNQEDKEE